MEWKSEIVLDPCAGPVYTLRPNGALRLELRRNAPAGRHGGRSYGACLFKTDNGMQTCIWHDDRIDAADDCQARTTALRAALAHVEAVAADVGTTASALRDARMNLEIVRPDEKFELTERTERYPCLRKDGETESVMGCITSATALYCGSEVRTHAFVCGLIPHRYLTTDGCDTGDVRMDTKDPEARTYVKRLLDRFYEINERYEKDSK